VGVTHVMPEKSQTECEFAKTMTKYLLDYWLTLSNILEPKWCQQKIKVVSEGKHVTF